jgi:glycosyltransferase involved in cell wall biosynthesis
MSSSAGATTKVKLVIQIPCFNEEATLPETLAALPQHIQGIETIETLVIDDGSSDATAAVAQSLGVNHIVRLNTHRGLAAAYMAGLQACLARGADIIVNTDGDNQYCAADIEKLVAPILAGEAELVIGCRPIEEVPHFSNLKKRLQRLGSLMVRQLSGVDVPDATSGFRAHSAEAALKLNVISKFTYTLESLIQAGKKGLATRCVPIRVNARPQRASRLFGSTFEYLRRSAVDMLRIYASYEPLRVFSIIGAAIAFIGSLPIIRFLYLYSIGQGSGHVQSLIVGTVLIVIGFQILVIALLADLIGANRRVVEELLYRSRRGDVPG